MPPTKVHTAVATGAVLLLLAIDAAAAYAMLEELYVGKETTRALQGWDPMQTIVSEGPPVVSSGIATIGGAASNIARQFSSGAEAVGGTVSGAVKEGAEVGANAVKTYAPAAVAIYGGNQLTVAQKSLVPAVVQVLQGDTSGGLEIAMDAEIESAKQQLGTIASAIPGYNKLDPHCNGFICNAGAVGINMSCADAFIAHARQAYCGSLPPAQCDVIKGKKIDWVTEASATEEVIAGAFLTGGSGALSAALDAIAQEMKTQYETIVAYAGPVADDVIKSAIDHLGKLINGVTQCGLNIDLMAQISTSSGQQCAFCLCAPTPNAFTPFLAWKVNGQCNAITTAATVFVNGAAAIIKGFEASPPPSP